MKNLMKNHLYEKLLKAMIQRYIPNLCGQSLALNYISHMRPQLVNDNNNFRDISPINRSEAANPTRFETAYGENDAIRGKEIVVRILLKLLLVVEQGLLALRSSITLSKMTFPKTIPSLVSEIIVALKDTFLKYGLDVQVTFVLQDKLHPNEYKYYFTDEEKERAENPSAIGYLEDKFIIDVNNPHHSRFIISKIHRKLKAVIERRSRHELLSEVSMGSYTQGTSCLPPPIDFSASQPNRIDIFKCAENEMVRGSYFRPIPLVDINNGELSLIGAMYLVYNESMKTNLSLQSAYQELLFLGLNKLSIK